MLTGDGEMLMKDEIVEEPEPFPWMEKMEFVNGLLDKEIEKNEILQKQVANMEQQVADQRQQIADQRQQIADLRQQLEEYRTRSASISGIVRGKNTFELGVAEPLESPQPDR